MIGCIINLAIRTYYNSMRSWKPLTINWMNILSPTSLIAEFSRYLTRKLIQVICLIYKNSCGIFINCSSLFHF